MSAADRLFEAVRGARIGACNNQEVGIAPRRCGDLNFLNHVLYRHHAAVRRMAALLWQFLIFYLDRGAAGILIAPDRVMYIEEATEPGVAVADQRCFGAVR